MPTETRKPTPDLDPKTGMAHEIGPTAVKRRALFLVICFGFMGLGTMAAMALGFREVTEWSKAALSGTWFDNAVLGGEILPVILLAFFLLLVGAFVADLVVKFLPPRTPLGSPGSLHDPESLAQVQCIYCGYPRKNSETKCCPECGKPYWPRTTTVV